MSDPRTFTITVEVESERIGRQGRRLFTAWATIQTQDPDDAGRAHEQATGTATTDARTAVARAVRELARIIEANERGCPRRNGIRLSTTG